MSTNKMVALVSVAAVTVSLVYLYSLEFTPFKTFNTDMIAGMLSSLILTSLFIERATAVILIAWRGIEGDKLTREVVMAKDKMSTASKSLPIDKVSKEVETLTIVLQEHKSHNRRLALSLGLGFGIAVSAVGVRAIAPLLDFGTINGVALGSSQYFETVDVLITGALLGGGANGLHSILDLVLTTLDVKRRDMKKQNPTATP